jgi:hypothetical protein
VTDGFENTILIDFLRDENIPRFVSKLVAIEPNYMNNGIN